MKLTTTTHVSVDGVMQGLGGPDEDRRGGFERGGWALPLFDDEAEAFTAEVYQRADAFLFGRRTYEIFAGYWGARAGSDDPIASALNTRPKYVASTMLTDPQWADTTVLSGDVATAVAHRQPARALRGLRALRAGTAADVRRRDGGAGRRPRADRAAGRAVPRRRAQRRGAERLQLGRPDGRAAGQPAGTAPRRGRLPLDDVAARKTSTQPADS
jgi:dihydrofolate reductase